MILRLQRVEGGTSRRTFAGCHIGRSSILVSLTSATSKKIFMNLKSVPTVEYPHGTAVLEKCALRNGLNPTGHRQLRSSQSKLRSVMLVNNYLLSCLRDLKAFLYRSTILIRGCSSMKLLSGITSTPIMWFHFMVLQKLMTRHVLFRCGWMERVYVATWMGKRIPSV